MATLTVQNTSLAGITPTWAAAAEAGDEFANTGNTYVEFKNTSAGEITVTIQTPAKIEGIDIAEITVAVPLTSGVKRIGPFDPGIFNASTGRVVMTYSAYADLVVGAFKL
ncbi:hypothetical protein KKF61_08785 [Patescibacteria group bacterium]|nr:hypothetical protein [Patescibacteria group bacterium]